MTQVGIVSGIYADQAADFRTSYPVNLIPVPKDTGLSAGYLRPADGLVQFGGATPGVDRGGIFWSDALYRVSGESLIRVDSSGAVTVIGYVGSGGWVTFDYSFDRLAFASNGTLFYFDGATLSSVTDPDLGNVVDFCWIDGYFVTTDGQYLIVTELNNPYAVNPLKYGSSEADPDPVVALFRLRNELNAVNRFTIEVFDNVGGANFPFQRIDGALITKGAISTQAVDIFMDTLAFVGSGRNEALSIWMATNATVQKIATREIDQLLQTYTTAQMSTVVVESKVNAGHQWFMVHLPDRCIVYDGAASQELGHPVWFQLSTNINGFSEYKAKGHIYAYDKWIAGDPTSNRLCTTSNTISTHYGADVGWQFGTQIIYPDGNDAIIHEMELVGLPGRVQFGVDPVIWTSYSMDGETWSQERPIKVGKQGAYNKRMAWRTQGTIRHYRIQRFRGTSQAHISMSRLEVAFEPLMTRPG